VSTEVEEDERAQALMAGFFDPRIFQNNVFQVGVIVAPEPPQVGGGGFVKITGGSYSRKKFRELQRKKLEALQAEAEALVRAAEEKSQAEREAAADALAAAQELKEAAATADAADFDKAIMAQVARATALFEQAQSGRTVSARVRAARDAMARLEMIVREIEEDEEEEAILKLLH
jgi:hypothetical protein